VTYIDAIYVTTRETMVYLLDNMDDGIKDALRQASRNANRVFVYYEDPERPGIQIGEFVDLTEPID
jgi:hypothetical protein